VAGALAGLSIADYHTVNEAGTEAVAAAAASAGVRRFIHLSSLAAREPQLSSYAASKRAGEEAVKRFDLDALILRPPAIYGPGDQGTLPLLRELTRRVAFIPGRRQSRFSLIHAEDMARIIAEAVESDVTGLREVSDGRIYRWDDILAAAERVEGRRIRPVFLPRLLPSLAAAAAETVAQARGKPSMINRGKIAELYHPDWVTTGEGWPLADPISFEVGFARTVEWYREAGWLPQRRGTFRTPASSL
jgi:nucleoside-diphosphate-sugar epimerase